MIVLEGAEAKARRAEARKTSFIDHIEQFNLHRHLTTPSTRDLEDGVHNSRRLAHNARRLGIAEDDRDHRDLAMVANPDKATIVTRFNDATFGSGRYDPIEFDSPLPFGDGPGIQPGLPKVNIIWDIFEYDDLHVE